MFSNVSGQKKIIGGACAVIDDTPYCSVLSRGTLIENAATNLEYPENMKYKVRSAIMSGGGQPPTFPEWGGRHPLAPPVATPLVISVRSM